MPQVDPDALLAAAAQALNHRVRTWKDALAAELLRTLEAVAQARPGALAITAFACACRHACFEYSVPDVPESDAAPPSSALGLRLERHADTLDAEARRQEDVDARNNAISLWKAAAAMRTAARLLG